MLKSISPHLIIITLILLLSINLLALNLKVFGPSSQPSPTTQKAAEILQPTAMFKTNTTGDALQCPSSCISLIQNIMTTLPTPQQIGKSLERAQEQPAITIPTATTYTQTLPIREYYIPLGTGNTTQSAWEDLTSTETQIDPSSYGNIKEAVFIVTLRNPTKNGQVEAQLYNVTDNHPVWGSHVVMNNTLTQTITSQPITLASSNKLYRVQLKSTLSYQAFLDTAKIRIKAQ